MRDSIFRLASLGLTALLCWTLLRGAWLLLRRPRRRFRPLREAALALFAAFMAALFCMVWEGEWAAPSLMLENALHRLQTGDKIHLRPFHTIGPQLRALPSQEALTQLLGNTLLFMPWGFCLPLLWRWFRQPLRCLLVAVLLTCVIEGVQLFIDRFVEVDDLLLNALGSLLGSLMWYGLHRLWPKMDYLFLEG